MSQPLVSILVPNYKTLKLTTLCLRLIRKHTDPDKIRVIVIDNASNDASLDYLRRLSWIELIERPAVPGETPVQAHARALDLGMSRVTTPYVLSIHTDTLVKHDDWLEFLLQQMEKSPVIAGVGSWKLESKPWWRRGMKQIERALQRFYFTLSRQQHGLEGVGKNYFYLRSHCAMYRMDLIRKLNLQFAGGNMVAGKDMHKQLVDSGYKMIFIPSEQLLPYLEHVNHATSVLNPELSTRHKSVIKGRQRIEESLRRLDAESVLLDDSLD